jgi:hypothetical protein
MNRIAAYGLGAVSASVFYVIWFAIFIQMDSPKVTLGFDIGFALFFWLFEGFCLAVILMSVPWIFAVRLYPRWPWAGWVYFVSIGALLTFAIACATSSLSPKPLFIEDQTFFEGALIAAERQGICFGLAGIIHGFTYWFVGEKKFTRFGERPATAAVD